MNTIGTAMLHVTRTATVDPTAAAQQPTSLSLALAGWLARAATWVGRLLT